MNKEFRNYSDTVDHVRENYRLARSNQTYQFAQDRLKEYQNREKVPIKIWDAIAKLDGFIDLSDPDINIPNLFHLFQTAEGIRKDGLPDWFQLVGLIHDLGKIMYLWGSDEIGTSAGTQWGVVGDTFLLGCQIPQGVVYPEFNQLNPDMQDPRYQSEYGIYQAKQGLENCLCSWGHDEYLYQVLMNNLEFFGKENNKEITNESKNKLSNKFGDPLEAILPYEALYIIRYHSLYPWHNAGEYRHLMNDLDHMRLPLVQQFSKYDLYTKDNIDLTNLQNYLNELKPYYQGLIKKYLGETLYF